MIVDVAFDRPVGLLESFSRAPVTQAEFESFYRETARPLWGYLRRICGDRALADDLLQESYLRFCRARVPVSRGDWKPYLYRIGTNLAADWWRHSGRRAAASAEAGREPTAGDRGGETAAIRRQDLDRAFTALKPRERALLWLAYVEEMDHREIASALGLSRGSVKVVLFRARRKLADILERRGIGPEVMS
jgi:RNA polymerase sigma-70 factor (ECF subfamily)